MFCRTNNMNFLRATIACLMVTITCSTSQAVVWDGDPNVSGDFNDPNNWTGNTLPGTDNDPDPNIVNPEDAIIGEDTTLGNPAIVSLAGAPAEPDPNNYVGIGDLRIGNGQDGVGTFNHSSGDLVTGPFKWSFIGADGSGIAPSIGTYNLSGDATFTQTLMGDPFAPQFHIGIGGGRRDFDVGDLRNEGYLNVSDNAVFTVNNLFVGSNDDNYGEITQTGGTVNSEAWISIGRENGAQGVYNMSGGNLNVTIDGITVGESTGATGEMHLSGDATVNSGLLQVGRSLVSDPNNGGGSTGLLTVTGDQVGVTVGGLCIGATCSFDPNGLQSTITDGEGTLRFISNASGVSAIKTLNGYVLNDGSDPNGVGGFAKLEVDFSTAPPAGDILLVDVDAGGIAGDFDMSGTVDGLDFLLWQTDPNVGDLADWETNYGSSGSASATTIGTFMGLPEGAVVPGSGGRVISYVFGDGDDIGLVALPALASVPEPSTVLLLSTALCLAGYRRRT